MKVSQVWIIRDKDGKRCTTVDDCDDPLSFVSLMLNHYEIHLPHAAPYTADRYILASSAPRVSSLADLFINHIEVDASARVRESSTDSGDGEDSESVQ